MSCHILLTRRAQRHLAYAVTPLRQKRTKRDNKPDLWSLDLSLHKACQQKQLPSSLRNPLSPQRLHFRLHFTLYLPKKWVRWAVQDALREIIMQPLNPTDMRDGFIYMFRDVENNDMIKIRYTGSLQQRLKKRNSDCKRKHKYLTQLPKIPHVSRVERLMHIELMHCRKERRCESCNRSHREWFEVSERQAFQVFEKWRRWIVTEPYTLHARTSM